MNGIDWFEVARSALAIAGLAVALAAVSYADWRRKLSQPRLTLCQALAQPAFQAAWSLGLLLFCAGLALGSEQLWQTVAWTVLALSFFGLGGSALLRSRRGIP